MFGLLDLLTLVLSLLAFIVLLIAAIRSAKPEATWDAALRVAAAGVVLLLCVLSPIFKVLYSQGIMARGLYGWYARGSTILNHLALVAFAVGYFVQIQGSRASDNT